MKVLLAGDVHGNTRWMHKLCATAADKGAEWILQLGDFGYWEHRPSGVDFLDATSDFLDEYGISLAFCCGNHENHSMLRNRYITHGYQQEDGFWVVRPGLFYAARGHRWTWDGVRFLALGGAYSVDKDPDRLTGYRGRKEGVSWWPEEMITDEEVELCVAGGPTDVMVTHDCPYGVDIPTLRGTIKDQYPLSVANRERVKTVVRACRPSALFHGHYHERYSAHLDVAYHDEDEHLAWHRVHVEGLAHDGAGDASAIKLIDLTEAQELIACPTPS